MADKDKILEITSTKILGLWCFLPLCVAVYNLIMYLSGAFPHAPDDYFHEGNHYYPQSLKFYYGCFCLTGIFTFLYAMGTIGVSYKRVFNRRIEQQNPWNIFLATLLLWSIVCTFLSEDFYYSFVGEFYLNDGLSSYFFYAGVFITASTIRTECIRKRILWAYCSVVSFLSMIMIIQQAVHGKLDFIFPAFRAVVFNQFNHFGYILCMAVAAFAGLYLCDKTAGNGLKSVYICGLCFETYALLVNDTFGSYLAALIALPVVILFWYLHGNKLSFKVLLPFVLFLIISVASIAGVLPLAHGLGTNIDVLGTDVENIAIGSEDADHAGTGRFILWKDTNQRIKEHPVFGVGPEGLRGDNAITNGDSPHNEYLQIAAYLGIPGLILYLAALISLAIHHLKSIKKLDPLVLAVSGVTVTYLISACFGNPVFNTYPYFWMFTKDFIYQYRIFSSSIVSKIGDPYITRFSDEDFQKFIEKSISSSEIKCGDVSVTTDDRIMTLSTCTGDDATRRILQGVLVQVYISA